VHEQHYYTLIQRRSTARNLDRSINRTWTPVSKEQELNLYLYVTRRVFRSQNGEDALAAWASPWNSLGSLQHSSRPGL